MRHNAEEDAARIEAKLAALEERIPIQFAEHREAMEVKAQSVLALTTEMVEMLRAETKEDLAALAKAIASRLDRVRDPSTGLRSPFEVILINLFELHRKWALAAEEYGALGLPAAAYDEEMLDAFDYDVYAKKLLAAFDGVVDMLTAQEYDALQLAAEAFAAYAVTAAGYDLAGKAKLG